MWGFNHGSHIDLEEKYNGQDPFWVSIGSSSRGRATHVLLGDFYTRSRWRAGAFHQHPMTISQTTILLRTFTKPKVTIVGPHCNKSQPKEVYKSTTKPNRTGFFLYVTISQRLIRGWPLYSSIQLETTIWKLQPPS